MKFIVDVKPKIILIYKSTHIIDKFYQIYSSPQYGIVTLMNLQKIHYARIG